MLAPPKDWPFAFGRGRAHPDGFSVLVEERLVVEIPLQEAELPELIGDVLADIGHRAVRADDDLFLVLLVLELHHPAAGVGAVGHVVDRLFLLQQGVGPLPELEAQDAALAGEDVVGGADPLHRRQVGAEDAARDVAGQGGLGIAGRARLL